jgi:hypothetical protein
MFDGEAITVAADQITFRTGPTTSTHADFEYALMNLGSGSDGIIEGAGAITSPPPLAPAPTTSRILIDTRTPITSRKILTRSTGTSLYGAASGRPWLDSNTAGYTASSTNIFQVGSQSGAIDSNTAGVTLSVQYSSTCSVNNSISK